MGVLAVWVWGQRCQPPMSLGTEPPYVTKVLKSRPIFWSDFQVLIGRLIKWKIWYYVFTFLTVFFVILFFFFCCYASKIKVDLRASGLSCEGVQVDE